MIYEGEVKKPAIIKPTPQCLMHSVINLNKTSMIPTAAFFVLLIQVQGLLRTTTQRRKKQTTTTADVMASIPA